MVVNFKIKNKTLKLIQDINEMNRYKIESNPITGFYYLL